MATMQRKHKFLWILILGLLSAIGPFSIDMYLPGFPDIAQSLNTTVSKVLLSLSSFFIGICFGQFLYGPMLDRFGRKKPLYVGLTLYILASIGCTVAASVDALIWLRLLQALGGCVGMVAARAMVRDLFPVEENAKVFSLLMLVIGVSPLIAPTLGGYITAEFGWHYVFGVLTLMGLVILAAVHFALPESREPDTSISLRPKPIIIAFWNVFKVPQFYVYAFTGAVAAAGLYAYIAGSPYVFMELFKVSEKQYGWIFATVAMCLIGSSQLNSLVLRTYKSEQIIKVALFCQSLAGLALVGLAVFHLNGVLSTIILCCIFLGCQGFTFPNSSALSMAPFAKAAGSASALMGGIQMGVGAFTSALVSFLNNGTALPMSGVMAACAVTAFIVSLIGNKVIRYKANEKDIREETAEMVETL